MVQKIQNTELFSDLSSEESATINGGHYYDCDGYGRSVRYRRRPVNYHYRSYHYRSRSVGYGYNSYRGYNDCY
ncbi:MAG: hypothetical protein WBA93_05145 [Microcoleaceae cyanobacterium]